MSARVEPVSGKADKRGEAEATPPAEGALRRGVASASSPFLSFVLHSQDLSDDTPTRAGIVRTGLVDSADGIVHVPEKRRGSPGDRRDVPRTPTPFDVHVRRPAPLAGMHHEPGRHRVDEHVDTCPHERRVRTPRPEPLGEQRPGAAVSRVEPSGVPAGDAPDTEAKIGLGRGHDGMVMRVEQRRSVHEPASSGCLSEEATEIRSTILVVRHDATAAVALGDEVVDRACAFVPWVPRHAFHSACCLSWIPVSEMDTPEGRG